MQLRRHYARIVGECVRESRLSGDTLALTGSHPRLHATYTSRRSNFRGAVIPVNRGASIGN